LLTGAKWGDYRWFTLYTMYHKPNFQNAIKFVIDLRDVGGFSPGTSVSSTNKIDPHDITVILLKLALNTITH